jgi:purine-binding chemotaxis protein CheW
MSATEQISIHGHDGLGAINQYLTFRLEDEQYGIDILKVQEIKGYSAVTPIPNSPRHIQGVMNLRGTVVPVVDLRAKFARAAAEYDKFTVIVVVNVGSKVAGLIVDAVSDVLDVRASEIRQAPDLGERVDTRFISGMVTSQEQFCVLLNIEQLLGEDIAKLDDTAGQTSGQGDKQ